MVVGEGIERKFVFGGEGEDARKALNLLKFGVRCVEREKVVKRVGGENWGKSIVGMEFVGGYVWSFDECFQVFFVLFVFFFYFLYLFFF